MPLRQLHWAGLLLATPLLSVCGGEPTAPQPAPATPAQLRVSLAISSGAPPFYPGDGIGLTVDARATRFLRSLVLVVSGPFSGTLSMAPSGIGDFRYDITLTTPHGPYIGVVTVTAIARCDSLTDSAKVSFSISDPGPPTIKAVGFNALPQPGDTMKVGWIADDAAGISQVTYQVRGAATFDGGETIFNSPTQVAKQFLVYIPSTARLGDSVTVEVTPYDGFGRPTKATLRSRVIDLTPPVMTASVSPGTYDSILPWRRSIHFSGDTLQLSIRARDNHKVSWIGWRIPALGLGDSIGLIDSIGAMSARVPVTAAMDGPARDLVLFARDSSQNVAEKHVGEDFADASRRTFQAIAGVPSGSPLPPSLAYSPRDQKAIVAVLGHVFTFTLQPFNAVADASLPTWFFGVDLTSDADTAWAGSVQGPYLERIALSATPPVVTQQLSLASSMYITGLRITPDNRAVMTVSSALAGQVVPIVDLVTGRETIRSVAFPPFLTASGDRTILLGYDLAGQVMPYFPAADTFGTARTVAAGRPSLDAHGDLNLIGNRLYDGTLTFIRNVGPSVYDNVPSLMTGDGQFVYFALWPGYHKVRVSDGTLVEKVFLPEVTSAMLEMPDVSRLLAVGNLSATLVDLSTTGIVALRKP